MITKEDLEVMLIEDRKKLEEVKKQFDSLVQKKEELQKTIESEETLLKNKFGLRYPESSKEASKNESLHSRLAFKYKPTQDAAFEILLKEENKPTHIKDIYQRIVDGGKKLKHRSSVGVTLRRDPRFVRVGPNVFAITEEEYKKAKGMT
jgi:hypothetical protein